MQANKKTPLWHRKYIFLCLANMFLTAAVYSLLPLSYDSFNLSDLSPSVRAGATAAFGLGLFFFGAFNAYLVERYYRKTLAAQSGLYLLLLILLFPYMTSPWHLALWRMAQGAFWGVAQMVMGATLVNDLSRSPNRTRADYYYAWFGRLAIPLGLMGGIYIQSLPSLSLTLYACIGTGLLGLLLLLAIKVPFRAPLSLGLCSTDRFWQTHGSPLVFNLLPVTLIPGMYLTNGMTIEGLGLLLAGFGLAIVCEHVMFVNSDDRAEIVMGGILLTAALLIGMYTEHWAFHLLFGLGVGLMLSRFLIYFLKLSGHSSRGTSQHTHFLTCELGLYAGFMLGAMLAPESVMVTQLALCFSAVALYLGYTHDWFVKHRDRDFKHKEL